jgi:HPt (histidine-containing phosphotransfer) domain-containing protein
VTKPIDPGSLFRTLLHWIEPGERRLPPGHGRRSVRDMGDPGSLPDLPGIDKSQGLAKVGGNATLYRKLLRDFYKDHQHMAAEVRDCLDQGDVERAKRLVHVLKGVAGSCGATRLFEATRRLEASLDGAEVEDRRLPDFQAAFQEVMQGLAGLAREDTVQGSAAQAGAYDSSRASGLLERLAGLLEQGDSAAEDLLPEVLAALEGSGLEERARAMADQVEDYDFDEAAEALQGLLAELDSAKAPPDR